MRDLFSTVAPRYDFFTRIFSYGMDRQWKRLAVETQGARARGRFRRQNISYLSWVLGARLGSTLPQPVTQVLTQCRRAGRHPALASPGLQGLPGSEGLVVGPALDEPAAADANRSGSPAHSR